MRHSKEASHKEMFYGKFNFKYVATNLISVKKMCSVLLCIPVIRTTLSCNVVIFSSHGQDPIVLHYLKIQKHYRATEQPSFPPCLFLRPPGGSITVFSALFNKAVLLSYAFALDPYNSVVLYSFTIEIFKTGSTIIKNYCHYLRYT